MTLTPKLVILLIVAASQNSASTMAAAHVDDVFSGRSSSVADAEASIALALDNDCVSQSGFSKCALNMLQMEGLVDERRAKEQILMQYSGVEDDEEASNGEEDGGGTSTVARLDINTMHGNHSGIRRRRGCAKAYEQCGGTARWRAVGGRRHNGPTCCVAGLTCTDTCVKKRSDCKPGEYSQCEPAVTTTRETTGHGHTEDDEEDEEEDADDAEEDKEEKEEESDEYNRTKKHEDTKETIGNYGGGSQEQYHHRGKRAHSKKHAQEHESAADGILSQEVDITDRDGDEAGPAGVVSDLTSENKQTSRAAAPDAGIEEDSVHRGRTTTAGRKNKNKTATTRSRVTSVTAAAPTVKGNNNEQSGDTRDVAEKQGDEPRHHWSATNATTEAAKLPHTLPREVFHVETKEREAVDSSNKGCAAFGCGSGYRAMLPCQCNHECYQHGNCCVDYKATCA
eukprot:TRINITY_DN6462_c0_g2_i1.p1 TRINITY_DN6462_c0_g2~~TRINITY_DN6462_c0_g2_i1.p1  ORF type:complete len:453 (+),score=105.13 TRINITY_DN6462_c0_g2_i1:90-1448(+)